MVWAVEKKCDNTWQEDPSELLQIMPPKPGYFTIYGQRHDSLGGLSDLRDLSLP